VAFGRVGFSGTSLIVMLFTAGSWMSDQMIHALRRLLRIE